MHVRHAMLDHTFDAGRTGMHVADAVIRLHNGNVGKGVVEVCLRHMMAKLAASTS